MPLVDDCPLCAQTNCTPLLGGSHFHCPRCDLRFLRRDLHLPPDLEKARYELHENFVGDPSYEKFLEPLLHATRAQIQNGAEGLDYGAGPAPALAEMFRARGFSVEVYDPHFAAAPEKLARRYDFVVASEVIEHFYRPAEEFHRLFSLLKPGACLGLMTLIVEPGVDFENWYYRRDPTHVVFYSRQTLQWIAREYGFTELRFFNERVVTMRRPDVVKVNS